MMDIQSLITIIILGVTLLGTLVWLGISLFNGSMKKFIVAKMAEAETHTDWTGDQKKEYVMEAFKSKYKIAEFLLNCKSFIELVIKYSKEINYKK